MNIDLQLGMLHLMLGAMLNLCLLGVGRQASNINWV